MFAEPVNRPLIKTANWAELQRETALAVYSPYWLFTDTALAGRFFTTITTMRSPAFTEGDGIQVVLFLVRQH